jgi:NADPH-dependent ferric siderophore reductase
VKLQFPRAGAPEDERPKVRTYTVRDWDADRGLLTIDFVVHGDEGIAGPWAAAAAPGDTLQLRGPGGGYAPDPDADWHLLAGDISCVPAISASLPRIPAGRTVHVFLQVHGPEEHLELSSPGDLEVHWLSGDADETVAEAIAALDFPPGTAPSPPSASPPPATGSAPSPTRAGARPKPPGTPKSNPKPDVDGGT